jgi:hypothetical protein
MTDQDPVRLLLVLDDGRTTWTHEIVPRWMAAAACADFGAGVPWDGQRVVRALIVEQAD